MRLQRPIDSLKATARRRKSGYLQACLNIGKLDPKSGIVTFTIEGWLLIRSQYALPISPAKSKLPLGDAAHAILGPVAKAAKYPCLKGDGTTDLRPESPCAKSQAKMNAAGDKLATTAGKIITSAKTAVKTVSAAATRLILPPR